MSAVQTNLGLGALLIRMEENDQTIIFCNTKRMVDLAVQRLKKHRFDAEGLHGDLNQNQRERILNRFKEGEVKTIVATDVAARGIDVDGITLVVNYDLPADLDSFIHRVGRTGRIGRKGEAWSLVSRDDAPQLSKIMATYGLDIVSTEAPELPSGVERDPVNRQDDFGETADVFGFVTLQLNIAQSDAGSSRTVAQWFQILYVVMRWLLEMCILMRNRLLSASTQAKSDWRLKHLTNMKWLVRLFQESLLNNHSSSQLFFFHEPDFFCLCREVVAVLESRSCEAFLIGFVGQFPSSSGRWITIEVAPRTTIPSAERDQAYPIASSHRFCACPHSELTSSEK